MIIGSTFFGSRPITRGTNPKTDPTIGRGSESVKIFLSRTNHMAYVLGIGIESGTGTLGAGDLGIGIERGTGTLGAGALEAETVARGAGTGAFGAGIGALGVATGTCLFGLGTETGALGAGSALGVATGTYLFGLGTGTGALGAGTGTGAWGTGAEGKRDRALREAEAFGDGSSEKMSYGEASLAASSAPTFLEMANAAAAKQVHHL
jgi:hypothetical protein